LQQGHLLIEGAEEEILSKIRRSKALDEAVVKAVEELKRSPVRRLRSEEWSEEQGLMLFRGKVYVPKDVQLRRELVRLHHDTPIAGHPGRWKTVELISRNYWWPGITKFIFDYVDGCDTCQRHKNFPQPPASKLMSLETPVELWKNVSADFVTGLPEAQGFDALLVVVDHAKKQMHIVPTTSEMSALGLAKLYRDNVWRYHGLPDSMISD
jgi:Integrase zinc binding domain